MLRLIQCSMEFQKLSEISNLGKHRRGIYILYQESKGDHFEVLYVGMTNSDIAKRLRSHRRKKVWSHFTAFAVWPNITHEEIRELEALFRHIYRKSKKANIFNIQRGSDSLRAVQAKDFKDWQAQTSYYLKSSGKHDMTKMK